MSRSITPLIFARVAFIRRAYTLAEIAGPSYLLMGTEQLQQALRRLRWTPKHWPRQDVKWPWPSSVGREQLQAFGAKVDPKHWSLRCGGSTPNSAARPMRR